MDKDARRALMVAKNLLPERPIEAHPAFSAQLNRRDAVAPADDEYRGLSDSRLKVWANRPDPITRADHILNGNTVTTPEDEVLKFPTREHAINYIDSMVGHWPRYADGGNVAKRRALMVAKGVAGKGAPPATNPDREANLARHMEGNHPDVPHVLYIGTTGDFTAFNRSRMNPESDHGRGFYASNSIEDVNHNYAGEGPDLSNRIEKYIDDELYDAWDDNNEQLSDDKKREEAKRALGVKHQGMVKPVHYSMKNPVVLGGNNETFYDYNEPYNEQTEEYGEPSGKLLKVIDGIKRSSDQFDAPHAEDLIGKIHEHATDYGGIGASDLENLVKDHFRGLAYDPSSGEHAGNEAWRTAMEEAGHDGIIDHTVNSKFGTDRGLGGVRFAGMPGVNRDTTHYVAFKPQQIKSAIGNNGDFSPTDPDITKARGGMAYADGGSTPDAGVQKALDLTRDLNPQGLYSHAAEAALASPQAKGPLPQMLASLKGVKPDELKYSGVNEQFAGQPRVTREELAQHFQQGLPNIQETTLREGGNEGPAKYEEYTMPGGQNYREVLMHLPEPEEKKKHIDEMSPAELRSFIAHEDRNADFDGLNHEELKEVAKSIMESVSDEGEDLVNARHSASDVHYNSHWPKNNVLAHLRLKDRAGPDGEKILHAEEIQSDWGQDARREGTYNSARPYQVFEINTGKVLSEHATPEEAAAESAKHRAAGHEGVDHGHAIDTQTDKEPAPSGPYIGTTQGWTDLALKRLLHEAVAGGYDKIVWTPGAEQAKRFNLSRQVDALRYSPTDGQLLYRRIGERHFDNATVPREKLAGHIGKEVSERLLAQPLDNNGEHYLSGEDIGSIGGKGMEGYYDKVVPKSLLALARQHDPEAKLEEHEVHGVNTPQEDGKSDYHHELEQLAGGEMSSHQVDAFRKHLFNIDGSDDLKDLPEDIFRQVLDHAMKIEPEKPVRSFPGLTVTPRMRESIPKRGFKAYARGGEVEGYRDGGSPDDDLVRERLAAMPSITSPDPEEVKRALAIAAQSHAVIPNFNSDKKGNTYYNFKTPTDIDAVQATVGAIPGATPLATQDKSWDDIYKEGKGGTMINLGGDRSRLGRLTHIQGKALAWPVDLHAGPDYMREPNPGAVWANAAAHAGSIKDLISELQSKGPVYGAYTPMGPKTLDSSAQMSDALMSQIATQKLDPKKAKKFDDEIRAGMFAETDKRAGAAKHMVGWPGIENAQAARDFLMKKPGSVRSLIVKYMDKAQWHNAGFPHVGITRVALTDPALLKTGGNMVGHRIVRLNPDDITPSSFDHNTYPVATGGEYVGDVPLVQRHYAFPETIRKFALEPKVPGVLHPYSENPNARNGFRKSTEDQRITQTLDEPWLESVSKGLENQKKYGFAKGGRPTNQPILDKALQLTSQNGSPLPDAVNLARQQKPGRR